MKRWRHFVIVIGIIPAFIIYVGLFMYVFEYITGYFWFIDWVLKTNIVFKSIIY